MKKRIYKLKTFPISNIIKLENGILSFVCLCGRLGQTPLRNFNHLTRCQYCNEANKRFKKTHKTFKFDANSVYAEMFVYLKSFIESTQKETSNATQR